MIVFKDWKDRWSTCISQPTIRSSHNSSIGMASAGGETHGHGSHNHALAVPQSRVVNIDKFFWGTKYKRPVIMVRTARQTYAFLYWNFDKADWNPLTQEEANTKLIPCSLDQIKFFIELHNLEKPMGER